MKILTRTELAISMVLAVLSASGLLFLNETSFYKSSEAVAEMVKAERTDDMVNKLLLNVLNAETGHRGYLLTGNEGYLEPYTESVAQLTQNLDTLRQLVTPFKDDLADFAIMTRHISRKMAEMDLSLRMYKEGKEDAWKFVLTTDVGKEEMDAIRTQAAKLSTKSLAKLTDGQSQIAHSLQLSRMGITILALLGLLSFYMYLIQTKALLSASEREQVMLQQERDKLDSLVQERTDNLAKLATHLQTVREDERGDLARALHDELGSLLTAAKLDVARIKARLTAPSPETDERFVHLTSTLNSVIGMTRRIVEDLRPSSLSHLGLKASLEILVREFSEHSGITVTTDLEEVELVGSAQLTVYRLVQESLTNIGKYAEAKLVDVSLHNFSGYVTVEVKDNGKGFNVGNVGNASHGLAGMRHRVEAAGGRLNVASSEGHGTLVSCVLPKVS